MDNIALALKHAAKLLENDFLSEFVVERYKGWSSDLGRDILSGKMSLEQLASKAFKSEFNPAHKTGRQELLENRLNRVIFG